MGVPAWLRRCQRHLERDRAREFPFLARHPHDRQEGVRDGRYRCGDLSFIDLYSCFPGAVEIGCQELGIAENDPRGLTITGGLPYFGGPGNNYVMHSIVTMAEKLRANPGKFGLCTGNGWYVTKHSAGIYSTRPTEGEWQREDPKSYQVDLDAMAHPNVTEKPKALRQSKPTPSSPIARASASVSLWVAPPTYRFLANTPDDDATLTG